MSELTSMKEGAWRVLLRSSGYEEREPEKTATILEGITRGVNIDFEGDRHKSRRCVNIPISDVDEPKVNAAIEADVAAGKKAGPFDAPPFEHFTCSPIGAVPKRNSTKVRVIHHLSHPRGGDSINGSTKHVDQRLGSFDYATQLIRTLGAGCFLVKLDVEAAYKQVPVRPEDWPLLGFRWRGKWYYERVLPFGLKSSCRLWELYATALEHLFKRALGIECVVHYVDDFLFVVKDLSSAKEHLRRAYDLCDRLGLPIATDKTEGPATKLTFLGIELDTVTMTGSLSDEKLTYLHALLRDWEGRESATIKEVQSLEGALQWCTQVVRPGRSFLGRIRDWRKLMRDKGEGPHHITDEVRKDIRWWIRFAAKWNGVSLLYDVEWSEAKKLRLYTDACESGYGAAFGDRWIAGKWNEVQLSRARNPREPGSRSMPFLELLALVIAAATWGRTWTGKRIMFITDCSAVMYAVKDRRSAIARMMGPIRHLCELAAIHQFDFDCEWEPGLTNTIADALSRADWSKFRTLAPTASKQGDTAAHLPPFDEM